MHYDKDEVHNHTPDRSLIAVLAVAIAAITAFCAILLMDVFEV